MKKNYKKQIRKRNKAWLSEYGMDILLFVLRIIAGVLLLFSLIYLAYALNLLRGDGYGIGQTKKITAPIPSSMILVPSERKK